MKPIYWVIIGASITILLFGINIGVILLTGTSWWWILISIISLFLGWGTFGIMKLVMSLKKKIPERTKIDLKTAKFKAIKSVMYDDENADNFYIRDHDIISREGREGSEPTPIAWFKGIGTETNMKIDILVNLNNPKTEMIRLNNIPDEKVKEVIMKFAENPDVKVIEERTQTTDPFGRPTQTVKVIRSSTTKQKEKEEKEEAEKASAF